MHNGTKLFLLSAVKVTAVFEDELKIRETAPLEPGAVELKYHALGVGLIQDAELRLEEYGFI